MSAQVVHTAAPKIESTFKAREVEGAFDLYFYRPIGFRLAQFFAQPQDDAGGRKFAGRHLWCRCGTSLFLS